MKCALCTCSAADGFQVGEQWLCRYCLVKLLSDTDALEVYAWAYRTLYGEYGAPRELRRSLSRYARKAYREYLSELGDAAPDFDGLLLRLAHTIHALRRDHGETANTLTDRDSMEAAIALIEWWRS